MKINANDALRLLLIRTIRLYTANAPFKKGRYRITSLLYRLAQGLKGGCSLVITADDGRRFCIDPRDPQYHMGLLDLGTFEPEETNIVTGSVTEGHIAVDAGANYGWYTTLLSRLVGSRGSVYAFEAMPSTALVLRQNCRLNKCENVTILNCALGDRVGQTTIYDHQGHASGDASLFPIVKEQGHSYPCEMDTLDNIFQKLNLKRCDFIKCDVEGAELMVLKGAPYVLRTYQPTILLEINPSVLQRSGTDGVEILEEIRRHGHYSFQVVGTSPVQFIEPIECKSFTSYFNVLCHSRPRH